ncbi:hypothetical protein MPSEU_000892300 [Mayamaea pseudoterrestris]|nr:hypothetical protein MPSEU_000892300 [Mayamaea pseudoterrestris]
MSSSSHQVSVSVLYSLAGRPEAEAFAWDESNVQPARMGIPEGQNPTQPLAGDFSYSGTHDHGQLPALHQGGPMALMIAFAEQAKQTNDVFLTTEIQKGNSSTHHHHHVDKKARANEHALPRDGE